MKYRKQTETGDYCFGNNKFDYVEGDDALAYAIKSKLLLFYNEWWEDLGSGIPMFQDFLGQVNRNQVSIGLQMLVSKRIKEIEQVKSVDYVKINMVGERSINIEVKCTSRAGETAEVEVNI